MKLAETLRIAVRLKKPSCVVFHSAAVPAESVSAAVTACFDNRAVVVRLRSDTIREQEAAFLHEALMKNQAVVMMSMGECKFPAELLKAWEYFRQPDGGGWSKAGRFIHFQPGQTDREFGMLVLVLPEDYDGPRLEPSLTVRVASPDHLGGPAQPAKEIVEIGRSAVAVSMKELCFLHHRDLPEAASHGSVEQMLSSRRALTWRDLQRLLRGQADSDMLDIVEWFEEAGRLTAGQADFAASAIAFLRAEADRDERIGAEELSPGIYHTLWTYHFLEREGTVFRGQRDSRWRQDTTLLRPDSEGMPATLETVLERLHRTQAFLDALQAREHELVGRALEDDERLAIAQHYGFATSLLDYTRSLAIAAFFATGAGDATVLRTGDVGVIYYTSPRDFVAPAAEAAHPFDFAKAAGIRMGRLRTIEPKLPDGENRIARQKGLFIEGFDSRDLQRLTVGVLYFRQQDGEAFEDATLGITRARLLAPDSKLQQVAEEIRPKPPKLSRQLTSAQIPGDDLFGGIGLHLGANLSRAQRFLDQVAIETDRVDAGLWPAIRDILTRHLSEARNKARTADISATEQVITRAGRSGITQALDEVDVALEELAALAGLPRDELIVRFSKHRPRLGPETNPPGVYEEMEVSPRNPKARIVTAVAVFLVGLEYLRTVRGALALEYIQRAEMELLDTGRNAGEAAET